MTADHVPDRYVTCDACRSPFVQRANTFVERDGDIETVGLQCPHCGERFIAYRTNTAIRVLQARLREERERANKKIAAGVEPSRALRKVRQGERELKKAMETLAAQFA